MTHVISTGDRGQRFEIRYRWTRDAPGEFHVLGWTDEIKVARQAESTWRKAPDVETVWTVDRRRIKQ